MFEIAFIMSDSDVLLSKNSLTLSGDLNHPSNVEVQAVVLLPKHKREAKGSMQDLSKALLMVVVGIFPVQVAL